MIRKLNLFAGFAWESVIFGMLIVAIALLGIMMVDPVIAQDVDPLLLVHPDPARVEYYRANEAAILELQEQIMAGETEQRLAAFEQLSIEYPDAVLNVATELLDDSELEIATEAAEFLAASIVMSDHHGTGYSEGTSRRHGNTLNSYQQYMMVQHTLARTALRGVLDSPHPELREIAAGILASLSDKEALSQINEGVEDNLYSEIEAVNYIGLANPEIGGQYLEEYLETSSEAETRAAAVSYLGGSIQYQDYIRDSVLLDSDMEPSVRGAAANTLSLYDSDYQNYALIVTLESDLPSELYTEVIEGYITSLQADDALNSAKARALRRGIENYKSLNEDADMGSLEERLDQYSE